MSLLLTTCAVLLLVPTGRADAGTAKRTQLVGTFMLKTGSCGRSNPSGTYFRMIAPNGNPVSGPFFENPDSPCRDKSITPMRRGRQGGLVTERFQPDPTTAFTKTGSALAEDITRPVNFSGFGLSLATESPDPQLRRKVPVPAIFDRGRRLSGQVEAWSVAWNKFYLNEGSPKPGGSRPGLTSPVTGTYNATTHAYTLAWRSLVVSGPFNGYTAYWHLAGKFTPGG